jgi:predicted ATPase/DNA-binding XRE family transcriptional regulator
MENTNSFGYWIRRQRKALDLTQQVLADRVGCSLAAIKKIESDERRPSRQIAERIGDVLGVPDKQRGIFLEVARGLRSVDQLSLARELVRSTPFETSQPLPHNLPMQLTSFIGREHELEEVKHLLSNTRLLTLTGPGGTGKTRLALQLGAEMLALKQFSSAVWLVEFAPVGDPTLVTQTIAGALSVREQPGRTVLDALTDYVRAKNMLLILDNCEHLILTCAQIAESLLHAAPRLKILVTSREALGISGETAYRVPSLPLPEPQQIHDLDALAHNDCVHLFMDRASAADPHFRLKEKNAPAVADICRRLDGIPLAIELASARTKVFPPEEIAARLDDRFRLLTGGSRTALERHQTLFALIEWSHNLLSEPERMLLRRLAVFAGGWSFEAAQAVCGEAIEEDVLDLLTHLVDKSLVAVVEEETEEARYRLPETIRQYARDKLFESGEAENVRDYHLDFFLRFAETAEPKLRSAEQLEWLERVEAEYDNLRTALAWSLESGKSDRMLRLAGALCYFWVLRGIFSESYKWLNDALTFAEREQNEKIAAGKYTPTPVEMAHRAKALYGATLSQFGTLDVKKALTLVEESLRLWRELGDKWWTAVALELKALMLSMGPDFEMAFTCLEEGVALGHQIEDPWPLTVCLIRMGDALKPKGQAAAARPFLEEGVALARRIGDKSVLSEGLRELGSVYYVEGDLTAAESLTQEALANGRAIGSFVSIFLALFQLVVISCLQNDPVKAKRYCLEGWALGKDTGSPFVTMFALITFGLAASVGGEAGRGVRLLAASEVFLARMGVNPGEGEAVMKAVRQVLQKAQAQLGPAGFEAAWAEGKQMTLEQAISLATENEG